MSRDFYEFCYKEYNSELEEAEKLYQKVGIMLVVLPVLTSVVVKLGRYDLLGMLFARIDVFIYYCSCCAALLLIAIGIFWAVLCVYPRKYKRIGDLGGWKNWRDKYEEYIKKAKADDKIDEVMMKEICPRLAEAQTKNAPINEKRRKCFQKSVLIASYAIIPIAIQGIFYLLLKIQGL